MEEWSVVHKVSILGFLGAALFGATASKTHFCIMGSISDWINMGSRVRFRAWVLSIGIAILGAQGMHHLGWLDLGGSIYLGANFGLAGFLIGGVLFGMGMTLGAGCGQRTLVRVGGGNLKSLLVLIVMAITAYASLRGLLAIVRIEVFDALAIDLGARDIADQGIGTLLAHFTDTSAATVSRIVALVLGPGAVWYAFKDRDFRASYDNLLAGTVIGLLVVGAWYVTGVIGNDDFEPVMIEAITFVAPTGNTLNYFMTWTGSEINFGIAVVLGMIVGLVELQCAVVGELSDLGDAFGNLDQSYQTSSVTSSKSTYGFKAATYGASYNDQQDECDCNAIIVCATNKGEKDI